MNGVPRDPEHAPTVRLTVNFRTEQLKYAEEGVPLDDLDRWAAEHRVDHPGAVADQAA